MRGGRGKGRTLKSVRPAQFSEGKKKKEKEIKEKGKNKKKPTKLYFGIWFADPDRMQVSPCRSARWVLRFLSPPSQFYWLGLRRCMLSCLGLLLQTPNTLCALYRSIAQDSDSAQRPEILNTGITPTYAESPKPFIESGPSAFFRLICRAAGIITSSNWVNNRASKRESNL